MAWKRTMTRNQLQRSIDLPQRFSDVADGPKSKRQTTLYGKSTLAETYYLHACLLLYIQSAAISQIHGG